MAAVRAARLLNLTSQPPKGLECFTLIQALTSERLKIQNLHIYSAHFQTVFTITKIGFFIKL
jgi:hypothetical protein